MSIRIVSATPPFRHSPDHLHTPALAPVATTSSRSTSKCRGVAAWRKGDSSREAEADGAHASHRRDLSGRAHLGAALSAEYSLKPISSGPYLMYEDGAEAMEFLQRAFGFREVVRSLAPDDGRVWHAEMELDGARIYLGQPQRDYRNPLAVPSGPGGRERRAEKQLD